jgi:hypothetical protein
VPGDMSDERREDRDEKDQHDHDGAHDRHPVAAEPFPGEPPRALPLDRLSRWFVGRRAEELELGAELRQGTPPPAETRASCSPVSTGK